MDVSLARRARTLALVGALAGATTGCPTGATPGTPAVTAGPAPTASAAAPIRPDFELVPQEGHSSQAVAVAYSRDGALVATGGFDQSLRVWDREGALRAAFHCDGEKVHAIAFGPRGDAVAGACSGAVHVWSLGTGALRTRFGQNVIGLAWSPDGAHVATVGRSDESTRAALVEIWSAATGARERSAEAPGERQLLSVAWSPDGRSLVTASLERRVARWDVDTLQSTRLGAGSAGTPPVAGTQVAFAPRGERLAVGGDGELVVLELGTGAARRLGAGGDFSWRGDGGVLAVALEGGRLELRDARTGAVTGQARQRAGIERLALAPDGATVAVVGVDDPVVRVFATDTGRELRALGAGTRAREHVAFSPDGALLAVTGDRIELWDARAGTLLRTLDASGARLGGTSFSPDGSLLVAAIATGHARVWDVATGAVAAALAVDDPEDMGWSFAWAPAAAPSAAAGPALVAAAGSALVYWQRGRQPRPLPLSARPWVSALAFGPDGATLAVAVHRELLLVDTASWSERARLALDSWGWSFEPAWSPDGRLVATAAGPVVELWNAADGTLFGRAGDRSMFAGPVFDRDGRLVFASRAGTVELWPPAALAGAPPPARRGTGAVLLSAPPGARSFPFARRARSLAPSPDGRFVAAGCDERELALFDVAAGRRAWSDTRHGARIWSLAWHPASHVLASASGGVRLLRAADGAALTLGTVELPDRRLAAYVRSDTGAVSGDAAALARLRYRGKPGALDASLVPFEAVAEHVARPELVAAFWAGEALEPR
ncbi:MAG: WD40 repeat domain-containing protein [Myxococcales bacterium]|nr:WD40 repeat domain-containing protein [Myxococcales bacterium]